MFASIIFKPTTRQALRSASISALLAVTVLASQSFAARAQTAASSPAPTSEAAPATAATAVQSKAETVEDRITSLHDSLKITAAEEANWKAVAVVMRANAAAMEKLVTNKGAKDPATLTAVDDLKNYETFAQAHVTGIKKLIKAFDTLYSAMPAAQKKIADDVFLRSGREHAATHG